MSFVPTATAVLNPWTLILGALEKKINRQSYETWLKPTRHSHVAGKTLFVRIPSGEFQHIGDRYADLIQEGHVGLLEAAARFEPERDVRFSTCRPTSSQNPCWSLCRAACEDQRASAVNP